MIKDIAWHLFKKTGNISTFLEYKDLERQDNLLNVDNNINNSSIKENLGDIFGDSKNKGNSNQSS